MQTDASRMVPSLRRRLVWNGSTRSPRRSRSKMGPSSARQSGGMRMVTFCPMISSGR